MLDRLLAGIARFTLKAPKRLLVAGLLLTLLAAALIPGLEVLSARSSMNPKGLPEIDRYEEYERNFGTTGKLIIVLDGEPKTLGPFADRLAARLAREQGPVKAVLHRLDLDFFEKHLLNLLPLENLRQLVEFVKANEQALRPVLDGGGLGAFAAALPHLVFPAQTGQTRDSEAIGRHLGAAVDLLADALEGKQAAPDPLTVLRKTFADRAGTDIDGYFRSRDGRLLFLFVTPMNNDDAVEAVRPFVEFCRKAAAEVSAELSATGAAVPKAGFAGLPAMIVEENQSIRSDMVVTIGVAIFAVLAIILIGFGSTRRGVLVFIPLLAAGVWNLGLCALTIGHLNMLTSGFTAVLFGLGVDYGIFISARIMENLSAGMALEAAIESAVGRAGRTVIAAGGTTGLAFLALALNPYRGFAELGIIAGFGVLLVIVAYVFLLPPLFLLFPVAPKKPSKPAARAIIAPPLLRRFPLGSLLLATAAVLAAVASAVSVVTIPMDFDVRKLMPKGAESVELISLMAARSSFQPEFAVSVAPDLQRAAQRAKAFSSLTTVSRVDSVTGLVAEANPERSRLTQELKAVLKVTPTVNARPEDGSLSRFIGGVRTFLEDTQEKAFAVRDGALAAALETPIGRLDGLEMAAADNANMKETFVEMDRRFGALVKRARTLVEETPQGGLALSDLPSSLRGNFVGRDGSLAVMIYPKKSVYDSQFLTEFVTQLRTVDPDVTGYPATHDVVSKLIISGFAQASVLALIVVFLLLLLEFRSLAGATSAFSPLLIGGACMFGLMKLCGMTFNFANIIALPLVVGLAVDYGVFLSHRLREAPGQSPFLTVRAVATPVLLAAATTAFSIGALTFGSHRGVASLGKVLVLGIVACLLAALLALPAIAGLVSYVRGGRGAPKGGA